MGTIRHLSKCVELRAWCDRHLAPCVDGEVEAGTGTEFACSGSGPGSGALQRSRRARGEKPPDFGSPGHPSPGRCHRSGEAKKPSQPQSRSSPASPHFTGSPAARISTRYQSRLFYGQGSEGGWRRPLPTQHKRIWHLDGVEEIAERQRGRVFSCRSFPGYSAKALILYLRPT